MVRDLTLGFAFGLLGAPLPLKTLFRPWVDGSVGCGFLGLNWVFFVGFLSEKPLFMFFCAVKGFTDSRGIDIPRNWWELMVSGGIEAWKRVRDFLLVGIT